MMAYPTEPEVTHKLEVPNIDAVLLKEIEDHAVAIARGAGRILTGNLGKPREVKFKGEKQRDPVTDADGLSDVYLKKAISEKFPDHYILSEEGNAPGPAGSPFTWVIDPLDGTRASAVVLATDDYGERVRVAPSSCWRRRRSSRRAPSGARP